MKEVKRTIYQVARESFDREKKSIPIIIYEVLRYGACLGLSPGEYFTYGFDCKKATTQHCLSYLTTSAHFLKHIPALNKVNRDLINDKLLFKQLMRTTNVPTPTTIGYSGPKKRRDLEFEFITPASIYEIINRHAIKKFIVKPANGRHGNGVHIVGYSKENEKPFEIGGQAASSEELFDFLGRHCQDTKGGYILFEYLATKNTLLRTVSPHASPNIRVITLKLPGGEVDVMHASIRLGRANSVVSNSAAGALVAKIELDSGVISQCRSSDDKKGEFVTHHPDTCHPILGLKIPNWSGILAACREAAALIESVNSIGWDVLLNGDSPVIIEGNDRWGIVPEQLFGEGYLSQHHRKLLAQYGIDFPTNKLPRPSLKKLKEAVGGIRG